MRIKSPVALISLLYIVSLTYACTGVVKPYPDQRFYVLTAPRPAKPPQPVQASTLRIRKFRVSPRYETRSFLYQKSDSRYQSDYYHKFLVSPGSIITEEVRRWLTESGLFQYVTDVPGQILTRYILEGVVTEIYGDFRQADHPAAVLEIQLFLINRSGPNSKIVFQHKYKQTIPLQDASPEALVQGWNRALILILNEFEMYLGRQSLES